MSNTIFCLKIRPASKLQELLLVTMEFTYDGKENAPSYVNSMGEFHFQADRNVGKYQIQNLLKKGDDIVWMGLIFAG